jgi:outer membrane protein OmpA-like peptidoglycan-associated protein
MGHADCIGQNRRKRGYIFAMRFCRRIVPRILWTLALASATLRADPGDVESSRDYDGFPRLQGFVITDYDEDSPAEFDFPVAQPLPIDADHIAMVHVKGHRYVIRYELGSGGRPPSLFQTQRYYEKLASDGGFTVKKTGAVGDVTETFCRANATHETWVYLEPAVTANVLTIVESTSGPSPLPIVAETPTAPEAVPAASAPIPPAPSAPPPDPNGDSLYANLSETGRVILPFVFQPGKDELDDSSRPLVDRVVAMMERHPDLFLRIEGHTDNLGDPDDNLRLSAQRALAVQAMLIAADIDKNRLDAVGVGGLQPLADNNTAAGREKNRRIELVLWKKYPAFHAPAPDGRNYYPNTGSSSSPAKGL